MWVTWALIAVCVLFYVAMVVTGVSPFAPTSISLLSWGANLGVAVVFEEEWWRVFTATFLHGGLIHLGINMWCLSRVGPLVERLFGNVGFALLYLAAGVGGFLASAWAHPLTVSVGASGAIFGVIGALMAFLTLHRKAIPMSVVQPMRGGLLSFILYNGLFGAIVPGIDNAAHLGGLVTGFIAGLLVSRPWPVPRPNAGLLRQIGGGVLLAAVLIGLGNGVSALVSRNQDVVALVQEARESKAHAARIQQSMVAFNSLMQSLAPAADRYNQINTELGTLMERLQQPRDDGADVLHETIESAHRRGPRESRSPG